MSTAACRMHAMRDIIGTYCNISYNYVHTRALLATAASKMTLILKSPWPSES